MFLVTSLVGVVYVILEILKVWLHFHLNTEVVLLKYATC